MGTTLARAPAVRVWAALLALSTLAIPREAPPPTTFPVEAPIVHVEVTVTDKRGRPVSGLGPGDLVLSEDGRAVAIVNFRAPAGERGPMRAPAPATAGTVPAASTYPEEPITLVVYVDNWNLRPQDRARVLPGLASFLNEQLARGATRALVVAAGHEAHVLSPLTGDAEEVAAALRRAQQEPAHGQRTRSDERQAIDAVKAMMEGSRVDCGDILMLQVPIRMHAQARSQDLVRTLARLEAVIEALGTLPESKALFYVSGGLEQRPAIDLFHQLGDICPEAMHRDFSALLAPMQEYDLAGAFRALAARANTARVTVHPIDASGLQGFSLADVSQANRRFVPSAKTDTIRAANLKAGQFILADQTGGSAVVDANDPKAALARLADQIRGQYALSFTPDHAPEGRIHGLRVELRKKGLRVRQTPSYFHGGRAETGASRTLAALLVGLEEDTLGADVSVDPASDPSAKVDRTANIRISVPLARLSAVEHAGGRQGRIRVVIAVWRTGAPAKERPLEVRERFIEVPLPPAAAPSGSDAGRREFVVEVPLGAGHRELAVGVHDVFSRLATYRRLRVGS